MSSNGASNMVGGSTEAELEYGDWARWALFAILGATLLRLGWNALQIAPMHFDESQYWTYGESLDWGYYSKPPMIAWLIRLSTELLGDTVFGVRFFSPILHGLIAWMVFAAGRLLFDGRTGFWAALIYLLAPGVTVSATLMSTDPPMMLGWAVALYALARAMTKEGLQGEGGLAVGWWLVLGAAIGFGLLSKYTIIAFAGGCLGYFLFARQDGPIWRRPPQGARLIGPAIALAAAVIVFSPNLIWNAAHDFASFSHVGDNAKLGGGAQFRFDKLGEFAGAQFGVFGPISLLALIGAALFGDWRHEWPYRLLFWLCLPLLIAMVAQSFLSRAHPNWAAPAYIAGSILAAAWLLDLGRRGLLFAALALNMVAGGLFLGLTAYAGADASATPRMLDPMKKTRHNHAICERAMAHRGDLRLIGAERRLMADCLFAGRLTIEQARMLPSARAKNHYQLAASLDPQAPEARDESFLFIWRGGPEGAQGHLERFERWEVLEQGEVRTHKDRIELYTIGRVKTYRGGA